MTPFRKAWPWTRLPMSRPCMSVRATMIVSIAPSRTQPSSSARRGCLSWWPPLLIEPSGSGAAESERAGRRRRPALLDAECAGSACQLAGRLVELLFELGQLLGRPLRDRPAEAVPGIAEE